MVNLASGISAYNGIKPSASKLLQEPEQKMADALPDVAKGISGTVSAAGDIAKAVIEKHGRDPGHDVDGEKKAAPRDGTVYENA